VKAKRKLILVVEDDEAVNEFLVWVFAERGYDVASAGHGAQALELLSRGDFDAVVLDMVMPAVGGLGVINELRKAGVSLPIIVLSGHIGCLDVGRIKALGVEAVLGKPAAPDEIVGAVERAMAAVVG
jgi:CheY-like chemotaxis protein